MKASGSGCEGRRLGAPPIFAGESLHEYPNATADRAAIRFLWSILSSEWPLLLSYIVRPQSGSGMKRTRVIIGVGVLLLLLASVAVTWLQPSAVEVARARCLSEGWRAEDLVLREYRGTGNRSRGEGDKRTEGHRVPNSAGPELHRRLAEGRGGWLWTRVRPSCDVFRHQIQAKPTPQFRRRGQVARSDEKGSESTALPGPLIVCSHDREKAGDEGRLGCPRRQKAAEFRPPLAVFRWHLARGERYSRGLVARDGRPTIRAVPLESQGADVTTPIGRRA